MNNFMACRKNAGLSQVEVAERLNITQGAVSQWEIGDTMPRAELLPNLAALYGVTVDELLATENERGT